MYLINQITLKGLVSIETTSLSKLLQGVCQFVGIWRNTPHLIDESKRLIAALVQHMQRAFKFKIVDLRNNLFISRTMVHLVPYNKDTESCFRVNLYLDTLRDTKSIIFSSIPDTLTWETVLPPDTLSPFQWIDIISYLSV